MIAVSMPMRPTLQVTSTPTPRPGDAELRHLAEHARSIPRPMLAEILGVSLRVATRRRQGHGWLVAEWGRLAAALGVRPSALLEVPKLGDPS